LEELESGATIIPYTRPILQRFVLLKAELARCQSLKGEQLIDGIFPAGQDWADPLVELKGNFEDDEFGPKELLAVIQRHVTQPELPTDVDFVRIMSLHKSKGLTAETVVVMGCLEGLLPFIDFDAAQSEQRGSLEEQRRLFYVAITRARKTLVLSSVTQLLTKTAHRMRARVGRSRGSNSSTMTSRFVGELGPKCPPTIIGEDFLRSAS
jgi:hypothetical protein